MSDDAAETVGLTRDAALLLARAEASRDLEEGSASLSYVAFVSNFHDYCLCRFLPEAGGW